MNINITLIILFISFTVNSQESENYKKIAKQVAFLKSETFLEKFKNDSIKREFSISKYNIDGEIHKFYSGKYIEYYKNGNVKFERINDRFGLPLSTKNYLNNGYLWMSTNTIELDTNAKTIEDFLFGKLNTSLIEEYKENKGTDSSNKPLLFKKGILINNKKSGIWNKYKEGEIIKTKKYKDRIKFEDPVRTIHKK